MGPLFGHRFDPAFILGLPAGVTRELAGSVAVRPASSQVLLRRG